jgi:hypothetical protein
MRLDGWSMICTEIHAEMILPCSYKYEHYYTPSLSHLWRSWLRGDFISVAMFSLKASPRQWKNNGITLYSSLLIYAYNRLMLGKKKYVQLQKRLTTAAPRQRSRRNAKRRVCGKKRLMVFNPTTPLIKNHRKAFSSCAKLISICFSRLVTS